MKNATRFAAVLALLTAASACDTPDAAPMALPTGLAIADLDADHRRLLRATLAIDGGLLDETTVVLDVDDATVRADVVLRNVGDGGAREATLRVYGRDTADSEEVLLGVATDDVTITPAASVFVDFKDRAFETCGAGVDGACGLALDRNRNGRPNIDDLIAGIDPGPAAPFLVVSPSTLQFSSGIRLGDFGRQVIVTENLGDNPVRIELVQVAGGQGMGVALFNPDAGSTDTPRRRIDLAQLDSTGDGVGDVVLAPGEELFVAVSFAPVNSFLTTAAVQIVATDVVTGVSQGSRTKVIANSDGALRPRDPVYVEPVTDIAIDLGGGSIVAAAFPATELFSGAEISAPAGSTGLTHSGSSLVASDVDGATVSMPADAAFVVDVAVGERFTGALASAGDIDMALLELSDAGAISVVSTSRQQGESAEAVELFNGGERTRRLLVVLGRIDLSAPVAVAGALVADDEPLPFRLSCQLTKGPELDDVTPISPVRGPLEGGTTVTLRGRGFFMPATSAGPHARVSFNGVASISTPQVTKDEDGTQTIVVVLPPGGAATDVPVTVVVENPATGGGDGQAATLPEGFRYDLPRARLTRISPDVAPTTGGTIDYVITGAFFFDRHGAPRVLFGDTAASALVVDSATLLVSPPAHAAGDVSVTVENALVDGTFGDASEAIDFRFVAAAADAPTLTSISGTTGSALGGETVTVVGTGFAATSRLLLGGNDAEVTGVTATQIVAVTRPVAAAGSVDVVVANPDGQVAVLRAAYTFTLPAPAVSAVIPDRASTGGNAIVVVNGEGFRDDSAVFFENATGTIRTAARAVSRSSSTALLVTTPPFAAGVGRIVVENVDGQRASSSFSFFAPQGPAPTIQSISPSSGSRAGQTQVALTVAGAQTPSVVFGGVSIGSAAVTSEPAGTGRVTLKFLSPAGALGSTAVTVINADGQSASTTFLYVDDLVPVIVGLRPAFVHAGASGDEVLVFGEHLSALGPVSTLSATAIGAPNTPLSVQFASDGFVSLSVSTPLTAGTWRLRLVGATGSVESSTTFTARQPDVTRVTKQQGAVVELTGRHLGGELLTSLTVGGVPCAIVSADESVITCELTREIADDVAITVDLFYGAATPVVDDSFVKADVNEPSGDPCANNLCNGGECISDGVFASCACPPERAGLRCELCAVGFAGFPNCEPVVTVFQSCSDLHEAQPSAPTGRYTIDPDGSGGVAPFEVACDMTFDGGGWTQIASTDVVAGTVSAEFLDTAQMMAVANRSTQVHLRTRAPNVNAPQRFVTSRPGTRPIDNLRQGLAISTGREQFGVATDFFGALVPQMSLSCPSNAPAWPTVFHACGNAFGLHFFLQTLESRWNDQGPFDEPLQLWVRDALIPDSCQALQQEPGIESGAYFVGGQYQPCNFGGPPPLGDAIVVTDAVDRVAADGLCSLAEALNARQGTGPFVGCSVPAGAFVIRLDVDIAIATPLVITAPVILDGNNRRVTMSNTLTIASSANETTLRNLEVVGGSQISNAVFAVDATVGFFDVQVHDLTVFGVVIDQLQNRQLTLQNVVVEDVFATEGAVGIHGPATVNESRFDTVGGGGALTIAGTGSALVTRSLFVENSNTQTGSGGAVRVVAGGAATFDRCTFRDNVAALGGAVFVDGGDAQLVQCSLINNRSTAQRGGGAALLDGTLRISSSTIAGNIAPNLGAGLSIDGGTVTLKDSIVSRNVVTNATTPNHDCSRGGLSDVQTVGNNIIGRGGTCLDNGQIVDDGDAALGPVEPSGVMHPNVGIATATISTGACSDLLGRPLGIDPVATPRPTTNCTLGAVEAPASAENDIFVDDFSDDDNAVGCTLRKAIAAAVGDVAVGACGSGGARDRIVFLDTGAIDLGSPIAIDDVIGRGIVIDGSDGHSVDVVTITGLSHVFDVRTPVSIRGLHLQGLGETNGLGGTINVEDTSLRLEDSTIAGSDAENGGGIYASNSVVTVIGSTIDTTATFAGQALQLDASSEGTVERSTFNGEGEASLVQIDVDAVVRVRNSSLKSNGSGIDGGSLILGSSIVDAASTACSSASTVSLNSVASDFSCNPSTVVPGVLSAGLASNGGRTPTIAVRAAAAISVATCDGDRLDQRGRLVGFGACAPGAFAPVGFLGPACGDGFVDEGEGLTLAGVTGQLFSSFSGQAIVGSGARISAGPSLVVAASGGGAFALCDRNACSFPTEIAPGSIAAVAIADTSSGFAGPDITVIDTDGRLRAFADNGSSTPVLTTQLDGEMATVVDAIFFADVFGGGGDDFVVSGLDADGNGVVHYYSTNGGTFTLVQTLPAFGTPTPGLVVRRVASGYRVLVPMQVSGGANRQSLLTINSNATTLPTVDLSTTVAGTFVQGGATTATLMLGRNGVIWGAQNNGNAVKVGSVAVGDTDVIIALLATSVTAGDIDGDGNDELVAIDNDGFIVVLQETGNDTWTRYDGIGSTDVPTGVNGARCQLLDVGNDPRPELVCTANRSVEIFDLSPSPDEQCDFGDPFGPPCTEACLIGGGP